jgi:protein SCO1/2
MNRRRYLETLTATGALATAGCLDALPVGGGDSQTVLSEPEIDLSEAVHPSYGDEIPSITLPDPILGEQVSTEELAGERAQLLTFFYTNCPDGMCPALILRLRRAQELAASEGYTDDAAFLPITFDPERDTEEVLREYANDRSIDLDAGNWHFLRPESYEAGQEVIGENFGLQIEKREAEDYDNLEYLFPHYNLILLVNKQGIVERAYPNAVGVDVSTVTDDFEEVVTA